MNDTPGSMLGQPMNVRKCGVSYHVLLAAD